MTFGEFRPMNFPISGRRFYRGRNIGCVPVIPNIALVGEVIESCERQSDSQDDNSPSAQCRHIVCPDRSRSDRKGLKVASIIRLGLHSEYSTIGVSNKKQIVNRNWKPLP